MDTTAAITYRLDHYTTSGDRLMGAQSASEGFLQALVKYGTHPSLYGYTPERSTYDAFCQQVSPWLKPSHRLHWVSPDNFDALASVGTLYQPNPMMGPLAWQRQYRYAQAYSLCGITHTLASKEAMASLGDLLIAPVQPWDALICTSQVVKTMVEKLIESWADYLAERIGARPKLNIQLPVIPLGVACEQFLPSEQANSEGKQFRQQWNIAPDDLVVLFVGRLIVHAKAHPVPMYIAMENAAQATSSKVHLIQAGWFGEPAQENEFRQSATHFSPSVRHLFLDGRDPEIRRQIWSVADVFVSLVDNIQETFGLTPVEAMAAGLPVIVSDWNGYQETVRHGVDGFRVPTVIPPEGSGIDLAAGYQSDRFNYTTYIGHTSMFAAVDISACTRALIALFTQPELRRSLGENGRKRAQSVYDWKVVIAAYEALWAELHDIRISPLAASRSTPAPTHPLCDDPFRLFSHYSSQPLQPEDVLGLGSMAKPASLQALRSYRITHFGASRRVSEALIDRLLGAISQEGPLSVETLTQRYAAANQRTHVYLTRTLVYLIKFDVLRRIS